MRTVVSVPSSLKEAADKLARRLKKSLSALYSEALSEYIALHEPEDVTLAMNSVCESLDSRPDSFVQEAARRVISKADW
jgi:predicted DNA-binding protein